ncbi:MAG: hypothetical protein GC136_11085 [Alphaproteobacteria bacterium]|nr:hypothetical protein [Alphaproteobacteria bacterium]
MSKEWSVPYRVDDLKDDAYISIEANADICAALKERYEVNAVNNLKADIRIQREIGGNNVFVTGTLVGSVTQPCVVSLEPVTTEIHDEFEAYFADKSQVLPFKAAKAKLEAKAGAMEQEVLDEREDPEEIIEGIIDLGELVAQYFSLAIPTYPRGAAAEEAAVIGHEKLQEGRVSPFAALKDWKKDGK